MNCPGILKEVMGMSALGAGVAAAGFLLYRHARTQTVVANFSVPAEVRADGAVWGALSRMAALRRADLPVLERAARRYATLVELRRRLEVAEPADVALSVSADAMQVFESLRYYLHQFYERTGVVTERGWVQYYQGTERDVAPMNPDLRDAHTVVMVSAEGLLHAIRMGVLNAADARTGCSF